MKKSLVLFAALSIVAACDKAKETESEDPVLTLSHNDLELVSGENFTLTCDIVPESEAALVWTSADETVATVDNGTVTAVAQGETEIIVSLEDGAVSDTCYVGVVRMKFDWVPIPEGTFLMGSSDGSNVDDSDGTGLNLPPSDPDREPSEHQHRVNISAFEMSSCEVTNSQYCTFLNENNVGKNGVWAGASIYNDKPLIRDSRNYSDVDGYNYNFGLNWDKNDEKWVVVEGCENYPALFVPWYGAYEFSQWAGVSLPTEAQWEYACRAGTTTIHFCGNTDDCIEEYAWYIFNSDKHPHDVGTKLPNPWGLYDMIGNAYEWCLDWLDWKYGLEDFTQTVTDPTGPEGPVQNAANMKVCRGGHWGTFAVYSRAACRMGADPSNDKNYIGFRVVRNAR